MNDAERRSLDGIGGLIPSQKHSLTSSRSQKKRKDWAYTLPSVTDGDKSAYSSSRVSVDQSATPIMTNAAKHNDVHEQEGEQ